ncbi:MAG: endonuclease MutS2 [Dehalococcoidia bacterium]|nr:endonuclease MutS2 [Dehalococcoidia bacterium]
MLSSHTSFLVSHEKALAMQPLSNLDLILERHQLIKEMFYIHEKGISLAAANANDIRTSIRSAQQGRILKSNELLEIAANCEISNSIKSLIHRFTEEIHLISSIADNIADLNDLSSHIKNIINTHGEIRDKATMDLYQIRKEILSIHTHLKDRMETLLRNQKIRSALQEPIITMRGGRYVFPVRADSRNSIQGVVHDISSSGATIYIEPLVLVDSGNKWKELQLQEQHEINTILKNLSLKVGSYADQLSQSTDNLASLDLLNAIGKFAKEINATNLINSDPKKWILNTPNELKLINASHPLLTGEVVSNTIKVGGNYKALLITGPNTGGKTVALKTAGLLTVMALSGLPIPAQNGTKIPAYTEVFADIGDEQSIEQSLSTFSGHIKSIINIISKANNTSLVLLDELGAGTDPTEGAMLGISIVEEMIKNEVTLIATTHHGELKIYAHNSYNVTNASFEFDLENISPTYNLSIGIPGQSYALSIASSLGMPKHIIDNANSKLSKEERDLESILSELNDKLKVAEIKENMANDEYQKTIEIRSKYQEQLDQLIHKGAQIKEEIIIEVQRELNKIRRSISIAQKSIKASELKKAENAYLNAEKITDTLRNIPTNRIPSSLPPLHENHANISAELIIPGSYVMLKGLSEPGEVLTSVNTSNEFEVQLGSLRTRVKMELVEQIIKNSKKSFSDKIYLPQKPTAPTEIEVRGQSLDEALPKVESFLDIASRSGHERVRVIHGRGTGAMRIAVRELFDKHPLVLGYQTAELHEGGIGVTVVKLARANK